MTKTAQDVTIYAGDTANIKVTVYDSDNSNVRKNITGSTVKWVMFDPDDTGVILTKTTPSTVSVTDATNGELTIPLAPADTEAISPGNYRHEAEITDASGNVSTVLVGDFIILESRA